MAEALVFEPLRRAGWPLSTRLLGQDRTPTVVLGAELGTVLVVTAVGGWPVLWSVIALATYVVTASSQRLYARRLTLSVFDDLPSLLLSALCALAVVVLGVVMSGADRVSGQLLQRVLLLGVLAIAARAVAYAMVRRVRAQGWMSRRAVVVGSDPDLMLLAERIHAHPECGLRLVLPGPVPLAASDDSRAESQTVARLRQLVVDSRVHTVIAGNHGLDARLALDVLRASRRLRCEVFLLPQLHEVYALDRQVERVWGVPLARLRPDPTCLPSWRVKRLMDVAGSAIGIALAAPVMAVIAAAVWLETGGVIFRQLRVGIGEREFALLKFQSMRPLDDTESSTRWNVSDDARIGLVGRWIRRTSIDELPQLFNVLRGDMSLVGPRPERPHFVREFSQLYPHYPWRHRVACGMTGLSAVEGLRGDTSIHERAHFDNAYVESWSLWLDVQILARTVLAVCRRTGS